MNSEIKYIHKKKSLTSFFIPTSLIVFQCHQITGFADDAYLVEGILFPA